MSTQIFDKTGREIAVGDILKVFHFTGSRRKKYYMYKQVLRSHPLGKNNQLFFEVGHLNMTDEVYDIMLDGSTLLDYEIVQGLDDHHTRERNV